MPKIDYAIDASGKLVHVDDVPTGLNCGCHCPCCNERLEAKNAGKRRIHHFAHASGCDCSGAYESMLHLLAKEKVMSAFLEGGEFWIEYSFSEVCDHLSNCPLADLYNNPNCKAYVDKRFDLKKLYDRCEQERPYDSIKHRSDLKIYSSVNPSLPPIYLEFCVTHASDVEKLHSGEKIIEIKIDSKEDVENIITNACIRACEKISFYGFEDYLHESACNTPEECESRLHRLAREKVRSAFLENNEFWLTHTYHTKCKHFNNCSLATRLDDSDCCRNLNVPFNLKNYYDSCEQEHTYDSISHRSDLKIYSSDNPSRSPVYFEFCISHFRNTEKLHKEGRVIEIRIDSQKDLDNIFQRFDKTTFYGFKYKQPEMEYVATLPFYRVMYDGKHAEIRKESCSCRDTDSLKKVGKNSIYEVCAFPINKSEYEHDRIYEMLVALLGKKYNVANCRICCSYYLCHKFWKNTTYPVEIALCGCDKFVLNEEVVKEKLAPFEMLLDKRYIKEL